MTALNPDEVKQLKALIDGLPTAMMTTAHDGRLRSRPMASLKSDADGTLWFMTSRATEKAHEIQSDSEVNLSYSDPSEKLFVSVSGRAKLVDDLNKKRDLWSPMAKVWFSGPEDPNLCLIQVDIQGAEFWDGPSSKLVAAYGWVKAHLTGDDSGLAKNETLGSSVSLQ